MITDVVVDTNVWVHASNPGEQRFEAALEFLEKLLYSASILLCVDEGFSLDEASNRSLIGREYLDNIPNFRSPLKYWNSLPRLAELDLLVDQRGSVSVELSSS